MTIAKEIEYLLSRVKTDSSSQFLLGLSVEHSMPPFWLAVKLTGKKSLFGCLWLLCLILLTDSVIRETWLTNKNKVEALPQVYFFKTCHI